MKTKGAAAEVFMTAFKSLKREERDIFLTSLLKDKTLREDLVDIALAEERAKQKGRPFREFLVEAEKKAARK